MTDRETTEELLATTAEWLLQAAIRRAAFEAESALHDAVVQRCITDYCRALDAPLIAALRAAAMAG